MPGTSDITQLDSNTLQQIAQKSTGQAAWVVASSMSPSAATQVTASSGNVAAASAVATLPAVASRYNFLAGFAVTSSGSTAAAVVNVTVTGLVTGTMTYTYTSVAGATLANQPLVVTFNPPIITSALNTAIVVTLPSLGAGNTNASVNAWGFSSILT